MRVLTDKLEPGMEVAADIMNLNDMLLLPKGAMLTARHIRLLKTWGIESVSIVSSAPCVSEGGIALPPELMHAAEAQVNERFTNVPMNDLTRAIKGIAIRRKAQCLYLEQIKPSPKN